MAWQKIPYLDFQALALPALLPALDNNITLIRRALRPAVPDTLAAIYGAPRQPRAFGLMHKNEWCFCAKSGDYAEELAEFFLQEQRLPATIIGQTTNAQAIRQAVEGRTKSQSTLVIASNFYRLTELKAAVIATG